MHERPAQLRDLIDEAEVRRIARLAQLELTDSELESLPRELNAILVYMEKLRELAVSDVEPTTHAVPLRILLRPDTVVHTLTRDEVLVNAPCSLDGMFEVPRSVEEGN